MWSINNVAFGEISHTALAYWQTGRYEEAFKMFKGAVLDAMYLGSGPGNVTQLSFYDAARRETYRDFADGIATGYVLLYRVCTVSCQILLIID